MSSNFTPLPLDNAPLSETLLITPPSTIPSVESPFFLATDRFSSYSSMSSNRPDSFMSEASSTRALNPLSDGNNNARGLGERRLSNLSNLNYGVSEEEKAEEEAIKTGNGGIKASVLPEGYSGGFGGNSNNYKQKSIFRRILDGRGKWLILLGIILVLIIIGGAVGATASKKNNLVVAAGDGSSPTASQTGTSTSNTPQSTSKGGGSTNSRATTGSNGSTVYAEDGTTFIYNNTFGKSTYYILQIRNNTIQFCNERN